MTDHNRPAEPIEWARCPRCGAIRHGSVIAPEAPSDVRAWECDRCGWADECSRVDFVPVRAVEHDAAIVGAEAIRHMLRWAEGEHGPDHAMSPDALDDALDELEGGR